MTSTVPESPDNDTDHDSSSADRAVTADTASTGGSAGGQAFRTLVVSTAAVALLIILALATGAIGGSSDSASSDSGSADSASGAPAPEDGIFALPFLTADGTEGTLADYHGQPLVVNFFASWCPPCRAELPDFEAVHQQLGDDVTFVGVNQDFTEESWKSFVAESQVSYDTVFQPQSEIWSEIGTQAMPTTVFISADGEIQQVWAGLITDDKLEEVIDETLLEPTS